jgi:hypothetical protein
VCSAATVVVLRPLLGTNVASKLLMGMNHEQKLQAFERRERLIDEALKESFPESDPPAFVGAGARHPAGEEVRKPLTKAAEMAAEMAGEAIDQQADQSATAEERESRKRRLVKGPEEFRELRRDHPAQKLT